MRVATSQIYNIANIGMNNAQTALTKTQEQMASGKRILSPADDPVAATQILQLNEEVTRTEQYIKNIDVAENSLNLEETALDSVLTLVQRMQELAVSAGNTAVLTPNDYKALVAEANSRIDELLNLQNTRDAAGQYIFSGYQGATQPFSRNSDGTFSYHGDEGQRQIKASGSVAVNVSDSGKRVFMDIASDNNTFYTEANPSNRANPPARISVGQVTDQDEFDAFYPDDLVIQFSENGAGDTVFTVTNSTTGQILPGANGLNEREFVSGQPIEVEGASFTITGQPYPGDGGAVPGDSFTLTSTGKQSLSGTLTRLSDAMNAMDGSQQSKDHLDRVVSDTLANLENAVTNISVVQGELGARLNTLESTREQNLDSKLYTETVLNDLEALDYAEASTRLEMQELVLSAAQKSFVKVAGLTLFNYIS
ncbi:flagellar hook-associated protein FlgL [Gilvimarinus xylanilyticus]|uniref:Flagellar hook-associated protein FlgL n=1 Tax=Gilvimarinus xylanilyticus TaxID=2944139 RepID=A0A9X2HX35_9GAMM|nr:flagellar hook-associated protein FlgL [Gilvimarinus xylanilyticus]MCP8898629.1 flagellar hook-associated protein FlgL [Gilvimarinus xylanilyticus]